MELNPKINVAEVRGKLLLTRKPCEYFQPNDQHDFDCFLNMLRKNESINYVLVGGRFVRDLPTTNNNTNTADNEDEFHRSDNSMYTAVLQAVSQIPHLTELEIWSVRVTITQLCQALSSAKNLFRLGLAMVTLDVDADDAAGDDDNNCSGLAYHPNLQYFYLSDFRLSVPDNSSTAEEEDNDHDDINNDDNNDDDDNNNNNNNHAQEGDNAQEQTTPCCATLDLFWKMLATCPRLHNVEVFCNQSSQLPWTPHGLAHLATCASLDQLTLRRLNLTSADIAPFAHQLSTTSNHQLRVLNLHGNQLKDAGCLSILRAIVVGSSNNPRTATVRELDLRDNQLSAKGGQALIPFLTTTTAATARATTACGRHNSLVLEKLNLASNPIGDECARMFAELLEQQQQRDETKLPLLKCLLKHLDLSKASISDAGCTRLAQALRVNTTLLSLNLAYNNMTNKTYLAFGDALRTDNRTLVSLNLQVSRQTKIELSGCAALLQMVEENYVLETVTTSLASDVVVGDSATPAMYAYYIRIFLRLNHAGRQKLLEQRGTKEDWINALLAVNDSLHAIYYLISTNPSLCHREQNDNDRHQET